MIYGWGINDADYVTNPMGDDGKQHYCPIYQCWRSMIKRCYASQSPVRHPTYIGCRVDDRWKYFMMFRARYLEQMPKSNEHLDKDFLGDGKLYSPENCCFVPSWLNLLFTDCGAKRGPWPQGVTYNKSIRMFQAQISRKGKSIYLGYFDDPAEASAAYLKAKAEYVEQLILENPHWPPRLVTAIRQKMADLYARESTARRSEQMSSAG